jgi:hypothetical protein
MTFGTVLSALGYPIFTALSLAALTLGPPPRESGLATLWSLTSLAVFAFGFVAILAPALVALKRRRLRRLLPLVPLLPLYYVLVSLATWRGLWELTHSPFRWNKTDHGHARTSRSGAAVGPTAVAGYEVVRR